MFKFSVFLLSFTLGLISNITQAQILKSKVEKNEGIIDNYILREMQKRQIPGLVYGICDKNGLVKVKAFGLADIQNQSLVREKTVFELASLTKQFTAAAIMLLVQENKIKLSDSIKLYLKECPAKWNAITIKHLLTHTSGLPLIGTGYSGFLNLDNEQYLQLL